MTLPTYDQLFDPILHALSDGAEHNARQIADRIAGQLELSEDDLALMLASGKHTLFYDRMSWARTYLKKAGLIEAPKRGTVRITVRGQNVLTQGGPVTLQTLDQYPEYVAFKRRVPLPEPPEHVLGSASPPIHQQTPDEAIQAAIAEIDRDLATELLAKMKGVKWQFFERLVVTLLVKMGYGGSLDEALSTIKVRNDDGIDGVIKADRLGLDSLYVQAKRWKTATVNAPDVQAFVGALHGQGASRGVFITTAKFSQGAREYAAKLLNLKVVLVDGDQLAQLLIENDLGVNVERQYTVKRLDNDFFEESE